MRRKQHPVGWWVLAFGIGVTILTLTDLNSGPRCDPHKVTVIDGERYCVERQQCYLTSPATPCRQEVWRIDD